MDHLILCAGGIEKDSTTVNCMKKHIVKIFGALPVYAANLQDLTTGPQTPTGKVMQIFGARTYEESQSVIVYIGNVISIVLGFLGVCMIGLIIYSGFLWMSASGEQERIKSAQGHLRNAIIGAIVVVSAWTITAFVMNALGSAAAK